MDHHSSDWKQPSSASRAVGRSSADDSPGKEVHASHRTQRVKIRGLVMDLPGTDGPIEICVNHQADWELIYKNPAARVKCLVESCDTLLTAKRMSRSGLRFLAVRSGGCSHNLVDMRVEQSEVEQDASKLAGGGGPEGVEHLWMKGRLYRIVRSMGAEVVLEHSLTHADVFLPEHNLVLEYQRWNTDFLTRTEQRSLAGAARTIWMFPSHLPEGSRSTVRKTFDKEVFQNGGIYVSVLNEGDRREAQRPWEDASQERTARLYASGSIAVYDPDRQVLVRGQRSLASILAEIMRGERLLEQAVVWKKSEGRLVRTPVWALRDDLARAEAAQEQLRRTPQPKPNKPPATDQLVEPSTKQEIRSERESDAELHNPPMTVAPPARELSADLSPGLPAPAPAEQHSAPEAASAVAGVDSTPQPSRSSPPTPRRSWWKAIADRLRRT